MTNGSAYGIEQIVHSLLFADVLAVLKMPSTSSSRITEHHSCSSTLLSVLLSMVIVLANAIFEPGIL